MDGTDVREVIYQFWSGFSVPAFEENSVPTGEDFPGFPYITFPMVFAGFGGKSSVFVSIWTKSDSGWQQAINIANSIYSVLKDGGLCLQHSTGAVWVSANEPFSRGTGDPNDNQVKRLLLDVSLQFN